MSQWTPLGGNGLTYLCLAKARFSKRRYDEAELFGDKRAFGVARPFHHRLGRARLDAAKLRGEVDIAAGIALLIDDLETVLGARYLEGFKTAAAEIVVDVRRTASRRSLRF